MKYLFLYLLCINIITFFIYGLDKWLARKGLIRVPEACLFLLGFIGGAIGAVLAMNTFRHKTKKVKFKILNILFILMWIYILIQYLEGGILWK